MEIIKNIIYICTYTKLKSKGIYFIIAVKNQEDNIEGFIRNLMFRILYGKEEEVKESITEDVCFPCLCWQWRSVCVLRQCRGAGNAGIGGQFCSCDPES